MAPPETVRVPWRTLLMLILASRLALEVVGLLAVALLPGPYSRPGHEAAASVLDPAATPGRNLAYHAPLASALDIWAGWDSEWYLLIADHGYDVRAYVAERGAPYDAMGTTGFLPLYPMLIRALQPLFGGVGAGVLVSAFALVGAAGLLFRLVADEAGGGELGRSAGLAAVAALLLHPMSLFLTAVYAESLFLLLSLAAFVAARRGRFAAAAAAAAGAALTRPFGVLLVVPLTIEWWQERRRIPDSATARWGWAAGAAPLAALAGFLVFLGDTLDDPLAFFERQSRWRGAMGGPWRAFVRWWQSGPQAHGAHDSTLEMTLVVICLALLPMVARRLRASSTAYAVLAVLVPLGSTVWSFGRLSLTVFPLLAVVGISWARGARTLPVVAGFVGGGVGTFLMALFALGWWAG